MHRSKTSCYSIASLARASSRQGVAGSAPGSAPIENQWFVNSGESVLSRHFLFQDLTQYQK
jgi:hypothetical protein